MYKSIAAIYPDNLRKKYKQLLVYAELNIDTNRFIGFILSFGFVFALGFSMLLGSFVNISLIILCIFSFILFEILVYFMLILRADAKGRFVESILPDALQLMASNLRAGLTPDRALLLAARPEFGPFQVEINRVGKEVMMGKEIQESLLAMTKRIRSEKLEKAVLLIVTGLNSGGGLSSLLEQTANNLRREAFVQERIKSSIMMYMIFIFGAIALGSPMLFGLSSFLVEVMAKNFAAIDIPDTVMTANFPFKFSKVSVTSDFVMLYAIVSIVTSGILGSLIIGLINKGKEREGLKYMPFLILVSLSVFFIVRFLIKNMLGSLFGI